MSGRMEEEENDTVIYNNLIADIVMISEDDIQDAINKRHLHILLKDIMIIYLFILHRKYKPNIKDLIFSRWGISLHIIYKKLIDSYYYECSTSKQCIKPLSLIR